MTEKIAYKIMVRLISWPDSYFIMKKKLLKLWSSIFLHLTSLSKEVVGTTKYWLGSTWHLPDKSRGPYLLPYIKWYSRVEFYNHWHCLSVIFVLFLFFSLFGIYNHYRDSHKPIYLFTCRLNLDSFLSFLKYHKMLLYD